MSLLTCFQTNRKTDGHTKIVVLREDAHNKRCFLVVRPLRFYPPYTSGLREAAKKKVPPLVAGATKRGGG